MSFRDENKFTFNSDYNIEGLGIVLDNFSRRAKNGFFENEEELLKKYDKAISLLEEHREYILNLYRQSKTCNHKEYFPSTYTIQDRGLGYCTVYERQCKSCDKIEYFSVHCDTPEEVNLPDWTIGAEKRFYNNGF